MKKSIGNEYRTITESRAAVDPKHKILIKGGIILSMDASVGDYVKGDVLIEGTKIKEIGENLSSTDAEVIDATDMIVMPGLIDGHRHAWQGALRRIMPNAKSLGEYVDGAHYSLGTNYRPEDMYVGTLITALGAIDSGITTMVDASHNVRSEEHSDASIDALEDAGIRAVYAAGKPLAGEWANHWPQDLERLQEERFTSPEQLLTLAMLSHPDKDNWEFARKLGLRIVTEFLSKPMGELLPGLKQEGLLGPDNMFNHVTGLTEDAWNILKETGVNISINPRSDAQYALEEGISPYQRALDYGMKPALGVDIETSYGGDMFTEMKIVYFMHRAIAQNRTHLGDANPPRLESVRSILEAATINGARLAGLENTTGSLTPGKQADIVLIRTSDINLFPSNNVLGTVVQATDRSNVDTVIIGGRIRKSGGKLLGVDHTKYKALVEESLSHLFKAVGYEADIFSEDFPNLLEEKLDEWTGLN